MRLAALIAAALALTGCPRTRAANPPALGVAAADVLADVDLAVTRSRNGDPTAKDAISRASTRFDVDVEPTLRATLPARDVLALEYGFARLHGALDRGADLTPAAAELGDLLRDAVGRASIRRE